MLRTQESAFWLCRALLDLLPGYFAPGLPDAIKDLSSLGSSISRRLPSVAARLRSLGVEPTALLPRWCARPWLLGFKRAPCRRDRAKAKAGAHFTRRSALPKLCRRRCMHRRLLCVFVGTVPRDALLRTWDGIFLRAWDGNYVSSIRARAAVRLCPILL